MHKALLMYSDCTMTSTDIVFKAIAHPARRKIISLLSESDRSVKQLTTAFAMTQPAVSQHLRDLKEAQLVVSEKVGMEQIYRLTGRPLRVVFDWSSKYKQFFDPAGHAWSFVAEEEEKSPAATRRNRQHGR